MCHPVNLAAYVYSYTREFKVKIFEKNNARCALRQEFG